MDQKEIGLFIEECYDDRCEKNHDKLRYEFEQDLIENGYSSRIVSECDDGWAEFCWNSFCDEFFGKPSVYMKDEDMYNILKKLYIF